MKLNQIVALVKDRKTRFEKAKTEIYHLFQKIDLSNGMRRVYVPKNEDSDKLPSENKKVQVVVEDKIRNLRGDFVSLLDTVLTQDVGNAIAKANISVDDLQLTGIPVTHLLFLEKQLTDLTTLVQSMPTLDPNEQWTPNLGTGLNETPTIATNKTKKVQRPLVLYPATPEHPAQTQIITEDVNDGVWETTKFSGAISIERKRIILERINKLIESVKLAREDANSQSVTEIREGDQIFDFIFKA